MLVKNRYTNSDIKQIEGFILASSTSIDNIIINGAASYAHGNYQNNNEKVVILHDSSSFKVVSSLYSPDVFVINSSCQSVGKLNSFHALEENWDGYGAEKPNHLLINESTHIVNALKSYGLSINNIYPLGSGGIQIDFNHNGFQYEIEVEEENICLIKFDNKDNLLNESTIDHGSIDQIFLNL